MEKDAPKCPSCGFRVFNRRYFKCESCGARLPATIVYSDDERKTLQVTEEEAERARTTAEQKSRDDGGFNFLDGGTII